MNKYRNRVVMAAVAVALLTTNARAHEDAVSYPSIILIGHTASVEAVAFSPDGKTLASSSYDETIRLRDVDTYKATKLDGHEKGTLSLAYSPTGNALASGGRDSTARIWNPKTGEAVQTYTGHQDSVISLAYSPDGKTIVSGSYDETIHLWNIETGEIVHLWSLKAKEKDEKNKRIKYIQKVAFSPDGKTIAGCIGGQVSPIYLWDVETGEMKRAFKEHRKEVNDIVFSPDGKFIASAGDDEGKILVWGVETDQMIVLQIDPSETQSIFVSDDILSLAYSSDGKTIASGGRDTFVRLWDVETGALKAKLTGHTGDVNSLAFSPDGKTLASAGGISQNRNQPDDRTVRIWNLTKSE
ncbi:MAG: WD40 repeat domain-containing protein [Candidatus Poribacteria bacterium]|nr:WD40 repeat domain-containing protein [Candidatus Poribacteria bacterium]